MNLPDTIMMIMMHAKGDGISRTTLQKLMYFLDKKFNLGAEYQPHFYGPYSRIVEDQIERLTKSGILTEKCTTNEAGNPRYDYFLPEASNSLVETISKEIENKDLAKIKDFVNYILKDQRLNSSQISAISKVQYIQEYLKQKAEATTEEQFALQLGWNIEKVLPIVTCKNLIQEINQILNDS